MLSHPPVHSVVLATDKQVQFFQQRLQVFLVFHFLLDLKLLKNLSGIKTGRYFPDIQ